MQKRIEEAMRRLHVLVVEDEETIRAAQREILSLFFASVDEAGDGVEALEKLKEQRFDILFVDLTMPRMDGLELIRRLRAEKRKAKIVVISAHNDTEHLLEAIKLGVDGYLLKPLERQLLLETIQRVVASIEAQRMVENYQSYLQQELRKKERELKELFYKDPLLNLPNRAALMERLKEKRRWWGIYIDLDRFDSINLVYGFDTGNRVLQEVGELLRKYGEIYALGGDRFFLLQEGEIDRALCYEILETIASRRFLGEIELTATLGVSDRVPLLASAEVALKDIRRTRRNIVGFYGDDLPTERLQRQVRHFLPLLKDALLQGRVTCHYQPIYDVEQQKVVKYEALVRFVDEHGRLYPAYEFIEVAKLSGLIEEISKVVVQKSFATFASKQEGVSINLDSGDLENSRFVEFIQQQQEKFGIEPSRVTFEILESIESASERFLSNLALLKKLGFGIAIDDFGSQNSNFERIHSINADMIKIDGKYIKDIHTNPKSYAIVRSIVGFCRNIGSVVVAEYVADRTIYTIIKELGVDFAQGWYIGKPQEMV